MSFARESQSIWTGSAKESWFNIERLIKCRSLLTAEHEAHTIKDGGFYLASCDVARTGVNDTSIMIIKVVPLANEWKKKVVYTENLHKVSLPEQAARLKELHSLFNFREITIDANGIDTSAFMM